jgi:hypothetical protein
VTVTPDHLQALLAASLVAWRVPGNARRQDDAVIVSAREQDIRVARAASGLPFRYTVTVGTRTRHASSVAGLLRVIRGLVDPEYQPVRLRIAPSPIVAS